MRIHKLKDSSYYAYSLTVDSTNVEPTNQLRSSFKNSQIWQKYSVGCRLPIYFVSRVRLNQTN